MRKVGSFIMACAMCLSMTVVGSVAPQVAVQAEETVVVEKKEAPTTIPSIALGSDLFSSTPLYTLTYSVNEQSWIEKITAVKVNDKDYIKVNYSWDMGSDKYQASGSSYNLKIGQQDFTENINKVVISAEGYKDLVLEVNKDGKTVAIHTNHTGGTATCIKKAVCDFCGEEYGDLAAHNYGDTYVHDGEYHWKVCQTEGCNATTEKEAHKGGTATTTEKAKCDVCGAEYGDLKKEDSNPADKTTGTKNDTKPAATTTTKNNTKPAAKPVKKTVTAKKVIVNKKSIVLKKGKKTKIKATLKPVNATEKVTFKSSNKKIAKVTNKGVVKAVKKGKCKITVKTASGKKVVVKVTVK